MSSQQTMRAWAQLIKSYDEVPDMFKDSFRALPINPDEFPYVVLTPAYDGFMRTMRCTPKLVCSLDNQVYVIEKVRNELVATCYLCENINYVEVGTILLKSWITISGLTEAGLTASTFKFSAVTLYLFMPIIEKIRRATNQNKPETDLNSELAKFNYLRTVHFKFMNYARQSIIPGEKVICTLLQPEIRTKLFKLFNRAFWRTISASHISILTDRELVIIREDQERWVKDTSYGGIWSYVPLNKVRAIALAENDDNTLTLSIELPAQDCLQARFSDTNKFEVASFLSSFRELNPALVQPLICDQNAQVGTQGFASLPGSALSEYELN